MKGMEVKMVKVRLLNFKKSGFVCFILRRFTIFYRFTLKSILTFLYQDLDSSILLELLDFTSFRAHQNGITMMKQIIMKLLKLDISNSSPAVKKCKVATVPVEAEPRELSAAGVLPERNRRTPRMKIGLPELSLQKSRPTRIGQD